jgi:hypothetical protein
MEQGDEPYSDTAAMSALFYKKFKDKLSAIRHASKICKEEVVEYGIDIRDDL